MAGSVTCKTCGTTGLHWEQRSGKLFLAYNRHVGGGVGGYRGNAKTVAVRHDCKRAQSIAKLREEQSISSIRKREENRLREETRVIVEKIKARAAAGTPRDTDAEDLAFYLSEFPDLA